MDDALNAYPQTPEVANTTEVEDGKFKEITLPSGMKVTLLNSGKGKDIKSIMDRAAQIKGAGRGAQLDAIMTTIIKKVDGEDFNPGTITEFTDELEGEDYVMLIKEVENLDFLAKILGSQSGSAQL